MQKQYRLKRNEEIGRVVQKRICARGYYYTVYYQKSDKVEIAFSVSKKYGNAVERNYAKRVMREICRERVEFLPCVKFVIVVKKEAKNADFENLKNDLLKQIDYICYKEKKHEKQ